MTSAVFRQGMRKIGSTMLGALILMAIAPVTSSAHPISELRSRSICRYEERYFVWTPNEPWKVLGRVRPDHSGIRVILQRSKYGHNWRKWKAAETDAYGRFRFNGIAPDRGDAWWVNLRVVVPAQRGHSRATGVSMYIDTNQYTRCG